MMPTIASIDADHDERRSTTVASASGRDRRRDALHLARHPAAAPQFVQLWAFAPSGPRSSGSAVRALVLVAVDRVAPRPPSGSSACRGSASRRTPRSDAGSSRAGPSCRSDRSPRASRRSPALSVRSLLGAIAPMLPAQPRRTRSACANFSRDRLTTLDRDRRRRGGSRGRSGAFRSWTRSRTRSSTGTGTPGS